MASRYEIKCINKQDRMNPHERITHVGGPLAGNRSWKVPQEDAIRCIEDKSCLFYVNQAGRVVDVIVATSWLGNKYLKTTADGITPDNLLSLYECR